MYPNFLNLPGSDTKYENSPVVIVPVPWEWSTTYLKGTAKAPQAILEASAQVEFYDIELARESWRPALHTLEPLGWVTDPWITDQNFTPDQLKEGLLPTFSRVFRNGKFPITLGGEHSLTPLLMEAVASSFSNLSVLQIDAHADLRNSYEGSPWNHACAMRRVFEICPRISAVGIRSVDLEEKQFLEDHPEIHVIWDHLRSRFSGGTPVPSRGGPPTWIEEILQSLTDTVYITIDCDGLDLNLIPAVGTPEPGGISWYELLALLKQVFQTKKVAGADIVELCPRSGFEHCSFTVAKLAYKLVGYNNTFQLRK